MKKYIAEAPNFNYNLSDYINVIKSMKRLQSNKEIKYKDERDELEEKFKQYLNVKYAITVTNCASGIDLACEAINLQEGEEVATCAINFYGTHLSVLRYKAKLVLVEPKNNSVQIDPKDLSNKINKNTKAVIITQMNGGIGDMNEIIQCIKKKEKIYKKKIFIIEDVARSLGAEYFGKKAGTLGDIGIYSFQTKKNFCTLGEGGLIVTNNKNIYCKLKELRSFGNKINYGTNYRLSRVQCSVGLTQLKKLDKNNKKRMKIAQERNKMLEKYKDKLYIEPIQTHISNIYTYYNVILNEKYSKTDRDKIRNKLSKKYNIETCIANEPTYVTHEFINKNIDNINTPLATSIGQRIISLPIHFKMNSKDNIYIVNSLIKSIEEVENENNKKIN